MCSQEYSDTIPEDVYVELRSDYARAFPAPEDFTVIADAVLLMHLNNRVDWVASQLLKRNIDPTVANVMNIMSMVSSPTAGPDRLIERRLGEYLHYHKISSVPPAEDPANDVEVQSIDDKTFIVLSREFTQCLQELHGNPMTLRYRVDLSCRLLSRENIAITPDNIGKISHLMVSDAPVREAVVDCINDWLADHPEVATAVKLHGTVTAEQEAVHYDHRVNPTLIQPLQEATATGGVPGNATLVGLNRTESTVRVDLGDQFRFNRGFEPVTDAMGGTEDDMVRRDTLADIQSPANRRTNLEEFSSRMGADERRTLELERADFEHEKNAFHARWEELMQRETNLDARLAQLDDSQRNIADPANILTYLMEQMDRVTVAVNDLHAKSEPVRGRGYVSPPRYANPPHGNSPYGSAYDPNMGHGVPPPPYSWRSHTAPGFDDRQSPLHRSDSFGFGGYRGQPGPASMHLNEQIEVIKLQMRREFGSVGRQIEANARRILHLVESGDAMSARIKTLEAALAPKAGEYFGEGTFHGLYTTLASSDDSNARNAFIRLNSLFEVSPHGVIVDINDLPADPAEWTEVVNALCDYSECDVVYQEGGSKIARMINQYGQRYFAVPMICKMPDDEPGDGATVITNAVVTVQGSTVFMYSKYEVPFGMMTVIESALRSLARPPEGAVDQE